MSALHLCVSQNDTKTPYEFRITGVLVFSFEEALYHCLHNWRQTMEDFTCDTFIKWTSSLGLLHIAQKMREIATIENFSMAFMSFLSITDYLPQDDLAELHRELSVWERRSAWEKLKDQGDFWLNNENGERAYGFYLKALKFRENVPLLNNAAIALMQIGDAHAAAKYFERALKLESYNISLQFNYIESLILAGLYDQAKANLQRLEKTQKDNPELIYFNAEIQFRQKNYLEAARLLNEALKLKHDYDYLYKLSDCYMRIRQFDKAFDVLAQVTEDAQDLKFLKKQAEHQAHAGNLPWAIKSIERALVSGNDAADLWTIKAGYHRMDYNLVRAQGSIGRAISASPDSLAVLLENARIKKAQGRTKDYQDILHEILTRLKKDYRKML